MHKNIYLTGFMGSGKSKIGRHLAEYLGMKFIDTDDVIESIYKKTITQLFGQFGEEKFRQIEEEIFSDLLMNNKTSVYSLGGGTLLSKQNLNHVTSSGLLIFIKSSLDNIWERTKNKTKRPLLLVNGKFPTKKLFMNKASILMEVRLPGYSKAQFIIDRDGKEAEEVVKEILGQLKI